MHAVFFRKPSQCNCPISKKLVGQDCNLPVDVSPIICLSFHLCFEQQYSPAGWFSLELDQIFSLLCFFTLIICCCACFCNQAAPGLCEVLVLGRVCTCVWHEEDANPQQNVHL